MQGYKELKEMVMFGLGLGGAIAKALEDGKFSFQDVFTVLPALMSANEAIQGANKVWGEVKDLDEAEYTALVAEVKQEFDIADDEVEAKIEMAFAAALRVAQLVGSFMPESPVPVPSAPDA